MWKSIISLLKRLYTLRRSARHTLFIQLYKIIDMRNCLQTSLRAINSINAFEIDKDKAVLVLN
jgi:hypothetical protein